MDPYNLKEFRVTPEHIALVKNFRVEWQDCEYGAPCIDPKRPYGNSSVGSDICEILEWEEPDSETSEYDDTQAEAGAIHAETQVVLQILTANADKGIKPGLYRKTGKYDVTSWEWVEE